ncbi:PREDICTED: uncharacterized protein LOC105312200 [Amphimedon queenslandica]|uniref:Protein-tyrosine-phosphatase n=1 Tax=Amphimedon queenslandica TaxID=400682 RepID=A0AAN0IZZ1_AMPQE|nr:PREDICTED: uncharacterized protein LOC105312200 [Amphimedon queenslandica]|eukprot:XP_019850324.1 PREDICTED: uncharacterized protein LOC105312200 [Amphimedon queenslandica]
MSFWLFLLLLQQVSSQNFGSLSPLPNSGVRLFLGEENITIANFSMIAAGLFHDIDVDSPDGNATNNPISADGQNDGLWCQSSLNQNMIGTWYYPDGTTVPLGFGSPLFANNTATGQIGLLRNGGIDIQGLYSCVIPNEEGINQTLYVAAYGNTDFIRNDELPVIDSSSPSFQLLSSVDADPPVFSLSFNVTNRSPTIVTCSVDNGNQFNVSDNDLIHTAATVNNDVQVQVLVTFRMRMSGLFKCSASTDRITTTPLVSTTMAMRNISVTGSPSNLTYSRDSLFSVTLGWSPSAVISATPQYHVFVNNSNNVILSDSTLTLSLRPDDEYNIGLVATGEDLPGEIITVTVSQDEKDIFLDTLEPTMISVNDSVVHTLILNFSSLKVSQAGDYVCGALLNDGAGTISITSNYSVSIQGFDFNHVDISINISSVPVAGNTFNLSCVILVPPNFVEDLISVRWTYDLEASQDVTSENNDATLVPVVRNGNIFTSVLTLDPVKTSDAGQYYCQTTINVFNYVDYTDIDLTVQTSPPSVSIVADPPTGPIYESTSYLLTCTATVNTTIVNTPVTASVVWTDPSGNVIPTNETRRQVIPPTGNSLVSMLLFQPIDTGLNNDGGAYTCQMIINLNNSLITLSQPTNTTFDVAVESLPLMTVNFSSVGSVEVGQNLTITCTITAVERLVVTPSITFIKTNNTDMEMLSDLNRPYTITTDGTGSVTNYTLILDPVRFEDSGMYTCMAEFNVTGFNNTYDSSTATYDYQEASHVFNLLIKLPPFSVSIVADPPTGPIYESTSYFLTCTATVNTTIVDTPVTASVVWTDPSGNVIPTNETRRQVIPPTGNSLVSMLLFQPIDTGLSNDGGTYTCQMIINFSNSIVTLRQPTNATLDVTVESLPPMTVNFSSVGSVEVGQSLTITCTIITVERLVVTPWIAFMKMNDTDMEMLFNLNRPYTITTDDTGSVINYTLILDPVRFEDDGMYTCMAEFNVTGFNNTNDPNTATYDYQEASDVFTLIVNCTILPFVATSVTTIPGTTSANISFIIPKTSYAIEIYSISYTGQYFQATQAVSMTRMSSSFVNKPITIMLTGLEEDNVYQFTVDSSNCLGTTQTGVLNFTTLPASPVASPVDCANITFLSYNVTLAWTAPALIDQNGAPVGYNLTCMNTKGVSVNGLSPTQTSMNTMFTITDVMPFTGYTCDLSFINVVGEGPFTQCAFETAQDTPNDGPQNFVSSPTMTTVTFMWSKPSIPNGIITEYKLRVANVETNNDTVRSIPVPPGQIDIMYTVDMKGFFSAYNNYTATVTASTVIGFGPISTTRGRTLPDMSSPPLLNTRSFTISNTEFTTIESIDNHTINVTWFPPTTPNGQIMNYTIDVNEYSGAKLLRRTVTDVNKDKFTDLIYNTMLTPGVPYTITLVAYNEFGRGMPIEVTVFTKILTPSVSPSGITVIRSADGKNVTITWNRITLKEARGFFEYTIRLSTKSSRKRQTGELAYRVPYTDTSYTATGLNGQAAYAVSMGLSVDDGLGQGPIAGPTSNPIEIASPDPYTCIMETTVSTDRGMFEWPVTALGSTANVSCPNGPTGAVATRRCVTNSTWESPNITSCATTEVSREFRNISKINITTDNVVTVSENLTNLVVSTTDTADQNTDNIEVVSTILNQTARLLSDPMIVMSLSSSELSMTTENTVQILDSIEEWSPNVLETESNNIINSFERIVDALINQDNFTNITIIEDDIALKGERFQQSEFSGIVFTAVSSGRV